MKQKKLTDFRKPTKQEIKELASYESETILRFDPYHGLTDNEINKEIELRMADAEIGVLEIGDTKTMIVIYQTYEAKYMLYQWKDDCICAIVQDSEWSETYLTS